MKSITSLNIKKKIIILSTTLMVAATAIIIFAVVPYFNQIQSQNSEIKDKRIQLAIYQEQRKDIDKTRTDLKTIEENTSDISRIFLDQENILDFLDLLDEISINNNLNHSVNIVNLENIEVDKYLQINTTLDGEWDNIISYLYALEKIDSYIILDDLIFSEKNESIHLIFSAIIYTS